MQFVRKGPRLLERAQARYGDLFTLSGSLGDVVVTSNPDLIKRLFSETGGPIHAGVSNAALLNILLGDYSLLTLDGPEHMRQRKLILPAFHGDRMLSYEQLISDATDAELAKWSPGQELELRTATQSITLEVIMRAVFGMETGTRLEQTRAGLTSLLGMLGKPYAIATTVIPILRSTVGRRFWEKFQRQRAEVDALLFAEIKARRASADLDERNDILSMMMTARDEDGREMTDQELRDECMTLLVAGHETTATALAWSFHWLLSNPAALERLKDELETGDDTYLDAVIKESLRLIPTVPAVGRQVMTEFEFGGYVLPEGMGIAANIYLTHRRPDLYEDPLRFKPERFLNGKPETFSWIPFGGGIRRCIGASFAIYEMKVAIPRMIEQAELVATGESEPPVRRTVTLAPKDGTRVRVKRTMPASGGRSRTAVAAG
jgi:cytochrome P450